MIKWCGLKGIWRTVKCLGLKFQYHLCPINANSLVTWNCAIMTQVWKLWVLVEEMGSYEGITPILYLEGQTGCTEEREVWPHRAGGKLLHLLRKWYSPEEKNVILSIRIVYGNGATLNLCKYINCRQDPRKQDHIIVDWMTWLFFFLHEPV